MNIAELITSRGLAPNALAGGAYQCDSNAVLVPVERIAQTGQPELQVSKLESLIDAIATGTPLPPIRVNHVYLLRDGHHRLALSKALGAAAVPVVRTT